MSENNTKSKKILIIGSGPIVIGQAAEFDYSGAQASLAAREEGYETIIVNNNPATIQTDTEIADKVYIEPLEPEYLEKIIQIEKPFGIIATAGGQTGLNVGKELHEKGILEKYNVKFLGTGIDAIEKGEDRGVFKELCEEIGEPVLRSLYADNVDQAVDFANKIGFPIIIRAAYTLGGTGSSTAYSLDDLITKVQSGLDLSPVNQVLLEKSLLGTAELEYEMMRDSAGNKLLICVMENIDPMGVHTGESIVVAPSQTLSDDDYQKLRISAFNIIEKLGIEGGCNVQFCLDQDSGQYYVIEVNPRLSRSSALASKATGYPIARVATKIALGKTLDQITNDITGKTAFFEPALDYIVVKIPRWPDDKFPEMDQEIGVTMKSTGEVMSIGRTFEEAMYKAIASLDTKNRMYNIYRDVTKEGIKELLEKGASTRRLAYIFAAFKLGLNDHQIIKRTKINRWFVAKLRSLHETRYTVSENINCYKMVDTCAGEFEAKTPYFYSSWGTENEAKALKGKKVIILGSGPIRIGQGIEFDYMTVHAVKALQKQGIQVIIINNNPETVSTDYSISDRLYFEPLTVEFVQKVIDNESEDGELLGVIAQFGGQTAISLAGALESFGTKILGTTASSIDLAEDRQKCGELVKELGYEMPESVTAMSRTETREQISKLGYPVLLRPSFVIGGEGMRVVHNDADVEKYFQEVTPKEEFNKSLLIDKFIDNSIEIDIDFISDGSRVKTFVLEQLDPVGIHSGDSSCVYPSQNISQSILEQLDDMVVKIAKAFSIVGAGNVQCAIQDDKIFIIEINPRASRTLPFVSKIIGVSLPQIATNAIMGYNIDEDFDMVHQAIADNTMVAIKKPVFSTFKITGVSEELGPMMKSTGEAMYTGADYTEAKAKFDGSKDCEVYAIK